MKELFEYLTQLPGPYSVLALALIFLIIVTVKPDVISKVFKTQSGDKDKKKQDDNKKRVGSYGDSVLALLGIREKYQHEFEKIQNGLLRSQMKFVEQKIDEMVFHLSNDFFEDISKKGDNIDQHKASMETALYGEALKNALSAVKDHLRSSFKENGFSRFSEIEYSNYVANKTKITLTIIRSYLQRHYVDDNKTIMSLKERFEKSNGINEVLFNEWLVKIFINAKDVDKFCTESKEKIGNDLGMEIDNFVKRSPYTTS